MDLPSVQMNPGTRPEKALITSAPKIDFAIAQSGPDAKAQLKESLMRAFLDGKALLLLDGLDEVKEHLLSGVRGFINHALKVSSSSRILVACRTFDYRQTQPSRRLPISRELELLPFSRAEQGEYIERWYEAAVRLGRFSPAQAAELAVLLLEALERPEIEELAKSLLLLALLTLIHSEEAKLLDTRSVLCDRAITYMLAESAKWRTKDAGLSTLAKPSVLSLAIAIAYYIQSQEGDAVTGPAQGITEELVEGLARQICDSMVSADPRRKVATTAELAHTFLRSHGLLLEAGKGRFAFAHRSFQEFLVGQYFAAGAHQEEALTRARSLHWREPFRLMASFAGHEGENIFYILRLIRDLIDASAAAVPLVQLGCKMLSDIERQRLALLQFSPMLESGGLWEEAQGALDDQVENAALSLVERLRSAEALGVLGDRRFEVNGEPLTPLVASISFSDEEASLGTVRLDERQIRSVGGFVAAPRRARLPSFCIGRYPTTNAVFSAFVHSDGYTNAEYWEGKLAKGWLLGDPGVLDRLRDHWLLTCREHHAKEMKSGEIDVANIEEECRQRTAPRRAPYYWRDTRFNRANQPVVGINWWEAAAFCAWATLRGHSDGTLDEGRSLVLPTEFEWERASRPSCDDRIYPWGDEWEETKAHVATNVLNMREPCPVGIYLESWPGGPCDMAGNIWEWTDSLHLSYESSQDARRFDSDSIEERVVRGSSWLNIGLVAACSVRCVDRSYNLFFDVGFRVASILTDDLPRRL